MAAREPRRSRSPRPAPPAAAVPLSPAARALALALGATLLLRALAALLPGRWLWGLDLGRDLPPLAFWGPWALAALLLVPPLARPLARVLPDSAAGTAALGIALALLMGALAWCLPDALQFTGDSGMRHGAFATTDHPRLLVPQAMPGDLWLHWRVPRWLAAHAHWPAERTNRALGAVMAVLNGLVAWRLARARGLAGAPALAVMAIAGWTAALALFSGYSKSFVELVVLELAAVAALLSVARGRGGLTLLGVVTALSIVLHRSGLALVPAWLTGLVIVARRDGWRRPALLAAALPPLAALAWLGSRLARTLAGFDATHHVAAAAAGPVALVAQWFAPAHLHDLANLLLLLVPALPLLPALFVRGGPRAPLAERAAFASLLVPVLFVALAFRPQQGLFRDWDVFVTTGVALAAWVAVRVGDVLAREARAAWLAWPVLLVAAVPGAQWLAHQADTAHGLERARAILLGPPERTADERATGFDRLSLLYFYRGDAAHMAEACSVSVAAAPNPRVIAEWAMAESMQQRWPEAQAHYLRAAMLNPDFTLAWRGVAATSSALGDRGHMELALRALLRLDPHGSTTRDAALWLEGNRPAEATSR